MPSYQASRRAAGRPQLRPLILALGMLAGLLPAGCRTAAHAPGHQEAVRTNAISNKRLLTEQPTLERPAPRVAPAPDSVAP